MEKTTTQQTTAAKLKELQRQNEYLRKRNKSLSRNNSSLKRQNKDFFWDKIGLKATLDDFKLLIQNNTTDQSVSATKALLNRFEEIVREREGLRIENEELKYRTALDIAKELRVQALEIKFKDQETNEIIAGRAIYYAEN